MYYTLTVPTIGGGTEVSIILDNGNGSYTSFPDDPTNPNYPAYQAWLDEGNVPTPFPGA
jgi:hypothetical protein